MRNRAAAQTRLVVDRSTSTLDSHILLITAEHAAALFGISRRAIYRLIEADAAHFTETANGEVLLCLASLAALTGKTEPNKKPEDR